MSETIGFFTARKDELTSLLNEVEKELLTIEQEKERVTEKK